MVESFNIDELEQFFTNTLDRRLDALVSVKDGLGVVVSKVIQLAQRHGWITQLVAGVFATRGTEKPAVRDFYGKYLNNRVKFLRFPRRQRIAPFVAGFLVALVIAGAVVGLLYRYHCSVGVSPPAKPEVTSPAKPELVFPDVQVVPYGLGVKDDSGKQIPYPGGVQAAVAELKKRGPLDKPDVVVLRVLVRRLPVGRPVAITIRPALGAPTLVARVVCWSDNGDVTAVNQTGVRDGVTEGRFLRVGGQIGKAGDVFEILVAIRFATGPDGKVIEGPEKLLWELLRSDGGRSSLRIGVTTNER